MELNQRRIQAILDAPHSFYGSGDVPVRKDTRLNLGTSDFLGTQFTPSMHVLDLGCGSGRTLLAHSQRFASGLGIDSDPAHIELAQREQQQQHIHNVTFRVLDFLQQGEQLAPESFDFVFSQRGPVWDSAETVQAALRVLRPDGMLFCEMIGELHHQEAAAVFGYPVRPQSTLRSSEQLRTVMQAQGVSIRLVSDMISKRYYPDIYAWLHFQSDIWGWMGVSMPEANDPRFEQFVLGNSTATGEIATTHHVVWLAGVKC